MGMEFRETYPGGHALITDPSKIPVAVGKVPFAYMLNSPQRVRVADYDTGKTLVEANGVDGTIVYLDANKGVLIDGRPALPIQLDPNERYGIYFQPK